MFDKIQNKLSRYRFEIRHISIFIVILILFQILLAFMQKNMLTDFLYDAQEWYKKDNAERIAIVTATSMELMFENMFMNKPVEESQERNIIYSFNVIFRQQLLQKSVNDISLILMKNNKIYIVDTGQKIYSFLSDDLAPYNPEDKKYHKIVRLFLENKDKMKSEEVINTTLDTDNSFNILVPFVPDGEYLGMMYMHIAPDFTFLTDEVSSNFDEMTLIYSSLMLVGLIGIFLVSSYAVKERNKAQEELYKEHEENLKKQIRLEKESLFTKRIYHTHHKAEKIMGFIKDDVRQINSDNLPDAKKRVITYSNFISRIIYDMKWYDQEINTIINPMFKTDINAVIRFIVDNVFLRISSKNEMFNFELDLDNSLPLVNVNEFVVWEILEPLIQNSIDHGNTQSIKIKIKTKYDEAKGVTLIHIEDNGNGIAEELMQKNKEGISKLFLENESTKKDGGTHSGYGCYIAYQMGVERCGWELEAINLPEPDSGCRFVIRINHKWSYSVER
ncbi:MAG: ATP-binding protein [Ignavibacteriaceae bacterium]|jgi:hypothetical protein|nr:ATP-binding protein [Ignavibacteriaceae bacterium]